MTKLFSVLIASLFFSASLHAADKIRIGFPDPSGSFLTLALGQKGGFFQTEGFQAVWRSGQVLH